MIHLGGSSLFLGDDVGFGAARAWPISAACSANMST